MCVRIYGYQADKETEFGSCSSDKGPTGAQGERGPPGLVGEGGPPGLQEDVGPRGPRGSDGVGRTVSASGGGARSVQPYYKWFKVLKTLTCDCVGPWVSQFRKYLSIIYISDAQAKMLLIQHVKRPVQSFLKALVDTGSVHDCLGKLCEFVKPSVGSVLRNLLSIKQKERELVGNFIFRFRNAAVDSGIEEERLKEALIEALIPLWRQQARAIVASKGTFSSAELIRQLNEISSSTDGGRMEMGARETYEENDKEGCSFLGAQLGRDEFIHMPASFSSMHELLGTLDDSFPNDSVLR